MTLVRAAFGVALITLILGVIGSKVLLDSAFSGGPTSSGLVAASSPAPLERATATATPAPVRPKRPHVAGHSKTKRALPGRHALVPTLTMLPTIKPRTARPTPAPTRTPLPTPAPTATPMPTAGTVTLTRYWVGSQVAAPGERISLGYVIDNETGRTVDLELGASLKPDTSPSWGEDVLSDPALDVTAVVPPGVTTHERFFTLPAHLHAGLYDAAWGLRDSSTGARVALVTAAGALTVR